MQEIDLRETIGVLLKHKLWIAALAIVAAIVAAVASFLLAPTYEATALVAVTKPRYEMQFDPRFDPVSSTSQPPYKAYPLLAVSDEVISALIADLGDRLSNGERTVDTLGRKLDAKNTTDPSIVRLTVKDGSPQRAAEIANTWAAGVVRTANELYAQSSDDLVFFTSQQAEAEGAQAQVEQALIAFQGRNETAILETELLQARTALTTTLEAVHEMTLIVEDARALRTHLQNQARTAAASPGDELTGTLIEVYALSHSQSEIEIQLSAGQDLGDRTVGDQIVVMDSLIPVLDERLALLQAQAEALKPQILALQKAYQEMQTEESRLTTDLLLAKDTFVSLSRKATEARIAAENTTGDVRLASRAIPIYDPVSPRKALNTLAGGVLGLLVGVVLALAIEYWRRGPQGSA